MSQLVAGITPETPTPILLGMFAAVLRELGVLRDLDSAQFDYLLAILSPRTSR
jgi:hypothetical protein